MDKRSIQPMMTVSTAQIQQNRRTSSSRMHVINHNWSATKQRPHPQSVAEISRHSVLSGDRIRQCETVSLSGCKYSHNGFPDVSRSNGGLSISGWTGQPSCQWQKTDRTWPSYLPGLLVYMPSRTLTSSYVRKATYPGCVTASTFQFRNKLHHGWNNLQCANSMHSKQ